MQTELRGGTSRIPISFHTTQRCAIAIAWFITSASEMDHEGMLAPFVPGSFTLSVCLLSFARSFAQLVYASEVSSVDLDMWVADLSPISAKIVSTAASGC